MPSSRRAASSARASPASTPGCARSPPHPRPGRRGGRAERPHRPHLRRPPAGLRLAAGPRRAAPGGPPRAPAGRAADARDGPAGAARPPAAAADHRQPPRPAGRPEPARPPLRRRAARHGLAGRHQPPADRRGLAVPGRDRGPGHARGRRLGHGRSPAGRAVLDALATALQRRRPEPGLVHHSDRGVQYAAEPYRHVLERHGIKRSTSRRGDCLDNAPTESFLASLEKEHVHHVHFRTRAEARAAGDRGRRDLHNRQRSHSASGYRTPAERRPRGRDRHARGRVMF